MLSCSFIDTPPTLTHIDSSYLCHLLLSHGFLVLQVRVAEHTIALVEDVPPLAVLQRLTTLRAGVALPSATVSPRVGIWKEAS